LRQLDRNNHTSIKVEKVSIGGTGAVLQ